MNLEEAKDELKKAMTGPYGKHWVYGPAVRVLMDAQEIAQKKLKTRQVSHRSKANGEVPQMTAVDFSRVFQNAVEKYIVQYATNIDYSEPPGESKATIAVTAAISDIIAERQRQINVEGYSAEHDDHYRKGELACAGAAYAWRAARPLYAVPSVYPWGSHTFRYHTPRHSLIVAAALLLAEIERMDRAAGIRES